MTASTDSGQLRYNGVNLPIVATFILVLGLAAVLNVLASNKYVASADAGLLARALSFFPSFLKSGVVGFVLVSLYVFRYGAKSEALVFLRQTPSWPALAVNVCLFLALAIWFANAPPLSATTGRLSDPAVAVYALSPLLWLAFGLSGLLALASRATLLRCITPGRLLAFGAIVFIGTLYFSNGRPLDIQQSPVLIEIVVKIASGVYAAFGGSMTLIGHSPQGYPIFAAGSFRAIVEPSCSGFQGVILISTILLGFTILEYRRLNVARVLLLIPIAAALMFLINAVRIAALFYVGANWSPEVALAGFHLNFGILSVAVVAISAVAFIELAPAFAGNSATPAPASAKRTSSVRPAPDEPDPMLLLPMCVIIGASVITGVFTGAFNWLYPVQAIAAAMVIYRMRTVLAGQFDDISLVAIGAGLVVYVLWILLIPADPAAAAEFAGKLYGAPTVIAVLWLFFRVVGSVIVVPIAEEMAFRGFLQSLLARHLEDSFARPLAIAGGLIGAAIIFGVLHANMLAGCVAGLVYGLVYLHRRRLGDAIIAHGVTNLLIAIDVLMLGRWSYW